MKLLICNLQFGYESTLANLGIPKVSRHYYYHLAFGVFRTSGLPNANLTRAQTHRALPLYSRNEGKKRELLA